MKHQRNPSDIIPAAQARVPWLLILSSIYVSPYFDLSNSKGIIFLRSLAEKIYISRIGFNNEDPDITLSTPPWYLSDFSETCIGLTDILHCFNDPQVIKAILNHQVAYILAEEKNAQQPKVLDLYANHLAKAVSRLDNSDSLPNDDLIGDPKKGIQLLQKYWVKCFESVLFKTEYDFILSLEKNYNELVSENLGLRGLILSALLKYTECGDQWAGQLRNTFAEAGKSEAILPVLSWDKLRKVDDCYLQAKHLFTNWWKQDFCQIKTIIVDYCARFPVGRYTEKLRRIPEKSYPTTLTELSSAFFITEEIIAFTAKILRDGPGVIVYPTPNLGAKKEGVPTPFTAMSNAIQQDAVFIEIMRVKHRVNTSNPYIQYTHPNKKRTDDFIKKEDVDPSAEGISMAQLLQRIILLEEKQCSLEKELESLKGKRNKASCLETTEIDSDETTLLKGKSGGHSTPLLFESYSNRSSSESRNTMQSSFSGSKPKST